MYQIISGAYRTKLLSSVPEFELNAKIKFNYHKRIQPQVDETKP